VSASCRHRLAAHYGSYADGWLDRIPGLLGVAAAQWGLTLQGYHDAGHASALALATDSSGVRTLLKAWFDPERHFLELAALQLWYSGPASVVIASDPEHSVAALRLVGSQPGGTTAPVPELSKVAAAIGTAHAVGHRALDGPFPSLNAYITEEVLPRIRHRHRCTRYASVAAESLPFLECLPSVPGMETVLHADLYRENVAFDVIGNPVLLDPLPMRGNAFFDWAFWSVYYRLGQGTVHRLRLAVQHSGADKALLLPWCLLLALDGLLFYEETEDCRADSMAVVLSRLIECLRGCTP
jgi:streptomycin 6-kinase